MKFCLALVLALAATALAEDLFKPVDEEVAFLETEAEPATPFMGGMGMMNPYMMMNPWMMGMMNPMMMGGMMNPMMMMMMGGMMGGMGGMYPGAYGQPQQKASSFLEVEEEAEPAQTEFMGGMGMGMNPMMMGMYGMNPMMMGMYGMNPMMMGMYGMNPYMF